ncbi:hypothetical protein, partial [Kaarinaea lacus]
MKKIMRLLITLFLILAALPALATKLPKANPVPGGIAVVPLDIESPTAPVVTYNDKRVMVAPNPEQDTQWLAITGIDLNAEKGKHQLVVETNPKKHIIDFEVKDKKYKSQHITIKNKRKVNPYKKDLERIKKEKKEIVASLSH